MPGKAEQDNSPPCIPGVQHQACLTQWDLPGLGSCLGHLVPFVATPT